MNFIDVRCFYCKREFRKEIRRYNEAKKFGWRLFCSKVCQYKLKTNAREYPCSNPECKKTISRTLKQISKSNKCFCSNSCAAKINNHIRELKRPERHCANEECKKIIQKNKYCSIKCQRDANTLTPEEYKKAIIDKIKEFCRNKRRIPFKHEMWGIYNVSRRLFGTWNKTIIAAGFKPNPVRFANKFIANDGHKCDSLSEKIIDDWLFARRIEHKTKVPYNYRRMTADFKINNIYIEFLGLRGKIKTYDQLLEKKEILWRERNLRVIKIYPNDLFPKNRLEQIFKNL